MVKGERGRRLGFWFFGGRGVVDEGIDSVSSFDLFFRRVILPWVGNAYGGLLVYRASQKRGMNEEHGDVLWKKEYKFLNYWEIHLSFKRYNKNITMSLLTRRSLNSCGNQGNIS